MTGSSECIAIIPARGGSVGIPRKNVKPLAGKPLLLWAVEAARAARLVNRVFVTTDDDEIADIARQGAAEVIRRPVDLAGPQSTLEETLWHALQELGRTGVKPDHLAVLHCTSPLVEPGDVDGALAMVMNGSHESVMTAADFQRWIWTQDENGVWRGVNHDERQRGMRQKRPQEVLETSAVYALQCEAFRRERYRFCGRTGVYRIPIWRAFEIDEPDDWILHEALMRAFKS